MAYIWDIETGYATSSGKYKSEREKQFLINQLL
jgi:hypothetical protein